MSFEEFRDFEYLTNTLRFIEKDRGFHLCIYDLSGIHHHSKMLQIPEKNRFHLCEFCEYVKSSYIGYRYCLRCKYLSVQRAADTYGSYTSQCYMGITEIVKPVVLNHHLASVIYLGNFYRKEEEKQIAERIVKKSKMLSLPSEILLQKFKTVKAVDASEIKEYSAIVDTLHHGILLAKAFLPDAEMELSGNQRRSDDAWFAQTVKDFIIAHYHSDIRLESLADLHAISANYLRTIFKRESGYTFTEYLNYTRIKQAKEFLRKTGLSVIDISVKVGFNNVPYFNKVFKKQVGISPSKYRNLYL